MSPASVALPSRTPADAGPSAGRGARGAQQTGAATFAGLLHGALTTSDAPARPPAAGAPAASTTIADRTRAAADRAAESTTIADRARATADRAAESARQADARAAARDIREARAPAAVALPARGEDPDRSDPSRAGSDDVRTGDGVIGPGFAGGVPNTGAPTGSVLVDNAPAAGVWRSAPTRPGDAPGSAVNTNSGVPVGTATPTGTDTLGAAGAASGITAPAETPGRPAATGQSSAASATGLPVLPPTPTATMPGAPGATPPIAGQPPLSGALTANHPTALKGAVQADAAAHPAAGGIGTTGTSAGGVGTTGLDGGVGTTGASAGGVGTTGLDGGVGTPGTSAANAGTVAATGATATILAATSATARSLTEMASAATDIPVTSAATAAAAGDVAASDIAGADGAAMSIPTGDLAATTGPVTSGTAGGTAGAALAGAPGTLPTPATAPAPTGVASAPTAPGSTATPVPLSGQVARPLFSLAAAGPGEHTMSISVSPDDLGPVVVRAQINSSGVRLELFAPTDSAREALRLILPELRRDLAGGGLPASLDLSSRNLPGDAGSGRQDRPAPDQVGQDAAGFGGDTNGAHGRPRAPAPAEHWLRASPAGQDGTAAGDTVDPARPAGGRVDVLA
ncbi:flagellar hook-length control protein FliK [Cryobacterium sp. W22_MBD10_FK3]|uniref:flagellar hook-length control protein FliK n=1 Tax=Cryobacterium sp. W22_MBD10_FK3 TaxID=3240273 RepID=UPI003F937B08